MIIGMARNMTKNIRMMMFQSEFSFQDSVNQPPAKYIDNRSALKENIWRNIDPTHTVILQDTQKSAISHRSNAEVLIHEIPVIKSHSEVVRCIVHIYLGSGWKCSRNWTSSSLPSAQYSKARRACFLQILWVTICSIGTSLKLW